MASTTTKMDPCDLSVSLEPKPQPDSPFLTKLPPEIRIQIYEHVFGHKSLHIFIYERRLVCLVCRNPTAVEPDGHVECIGMSLSDSKRAWSDEGIKQQQQLSSSSSSPGPEKRDRLHLAALLAVCRTMYLETAPTLYRTHTFHFSNLTSMTAFPRRLSPHHRALVRHVRIDLALLRQTDSDAADGLYCFIHNSFSEQWSAQEGYDSDRDPGIDGVHAAEASSDAGADETPWDFAWRSVAALPALQTLRVTIELTNGGHALRYVRELDDVAQRCMASVVEAGLLQALASVRCDDYLLRMNWPVPPGQPEPEYPFRIERFPYKAPM